MAPRFLSQEWVEEARRRVKASPEFGRMVEGVNASLLSVVTDAPGRGTVFVYHEFRDGSLATMEAGADPNWETRPALLTVRAPYGVVRQINEGTMTLIGAVLNGQVKLSGNVAEAMRMAPAFAKYYEIVRTVETEY